MLLDYNNNALVPDSLGGSYWWGNTFVQGILILIAIIRLIKTFLYQKP